MVKLLLQYPHLALRVLPGVATGRSVERVG
jgi:hypothetical protein